MTTQTDIQTEVYNDLKNTDESFVGTITKVSAGTLSPGPDTVSGQTSTPTTCYVLFLKTPSSASKIADSVEIKEGDRLCMFVGLGVVPQKGDTILVTAWSKTYVVMAAVDTVVGMDAMFEVLMR